MSCKDCNVPETCNTEERVWCAHQSVEISTSVLWSHDHYILFVDTASSNSLNSGDSVSYSLKEASYHESVQRPWLSPAIAMLPLHTVIVYIWIMISEQLIILCYEIWKLTQVTPHQFWRAILRQLLKHPTSVGSNYVWLNTLSMTETKISVHFYSMFLAFLALTATPQPSRTKKCASLISAAIHSVRLEAPRSLNASSFQYILHIPYQ